MKNTTLLLAVLFCIFIGHSQVGTTAIGTFYGPTLPISNGQAGSGGQDNVFLGVNAAPFLAGKRNVVIGTYSCASVLASSDTTINNDNVMIGNRVGIGSAVLGNSNTFVGSYSGGANSGTGNSFFGFNTGGSGNSNNNLNSIFGYYSFASEFGNSNSCFGSGIKVGGLNSTGSKNTCIGGAIEALNIGSYNTIIGYGFQTPAVLNNTIILADGQQGARLYINNLGNAGFGTTTPTNKLDVEGNMAIGTNYSGSSVAPANGLIVEGNIGIGTIAPGNKVEINSGVTGLAAGTSGLRFSNLKSTNTNLQATNGRVLTLNATGDVVLTTDVGSGGTTIINAGTNTTVTGTGVTATPYVIAAKNIYTDNGMLTGTRTVTMGNNNLIFSSNGSTSGNGRIYVGNTTLFPAITATSNYRLLVEGGILTEKVKVALRNPTTNWADYVFANDYKLMPLQEVEAFVNKNKHLPGISPANDLVKEGLDLADMQAKQMAKIEELTLYAIDQNKQIEKQNIEIEVLKEQVKLLLEKTK
jgi:trimeric autotransporter adhesin